MEKISGLKAALLEMINDQSDKNMVNFSKVLKYYVENGVWVHMPGKQDDRGFMMKIVQSRGKLYAAMFSDPSEVRNPEKLDIIVTDINKLLDPVFQDPNISGIVIDPYTTFVCLEKRLILQCILHGTYPPANISNTKPYDWGDGIPRYSKDDLMTPAEIQEFAMNTILDHEPMLRDGYMLTSGWCTPGVIPTLIFEKDGLFTFIYLKSNTEMSDPELSDDEYNELKKLGEKYNATCYWAPVSFISVDPERCEAGLALKGDGFYCKYTGLIEVGRN